MNKQHNIDSIFKEASKSYSAPTPKGAWDRLEGSLMKKRKKRRFIIWFITLGFMMITAGVLLLYYSNTKSISNNLPEVNKTENPTISNPSSDIKEIPDKSTHKNKIGSEHKASRNSNSTKNNGLSNLPDKKSEPILSQNGPSKGADNILKDHTDKTPVISTPILVNETSKQPASYQVEEQSQDINENGTIAKDSNLAVSERNSEVIDSIGTQKIDSIRSHETDSVLHDSTLIYTTDPIYNKPIKKAPRVLISAYTGVSISNGIAKGSTNLSSLTAVTNLTNAGTSMNFGLDIAYRLNRKLYASLGISRFNLVFKGDFSIPAQTVNYIRIDQFGNTPLGYYSVNNIDFVSKSKNYTTEYYLRSYTKSKIHIHILEFPVNVGYDMSFKKLHITPHLGATSSLILRNEIVISDLSGINLVGEIQNLRSALFGLSGGLDISYKPSNQFSFGVKSMYTHYMGSINNSSLYNFTPYYFMISPQLSIWF